MARKSREGTQIEKEEIFGHQRAGVRKFLLFQFAREDSMFVAETASLRDLLPELSIEDTELFKSFHDFSVNSAVAPLSQRFL